MDELIAQFAIEARELTEQASDDLLALEANPGDRERLESVFRAVHTLKGSVGLFDFGPMQVVLHHAEDLLSQARAGTITVDTTLIDPLLAVIEWIDDSIEGILQMGQLSEAQDKQAPRLLGLLKSDMTGRETDETVDAATSVPTWAMLLCEQPAASGVAEPCVAIRYEPHPECFFNGDDPLATLSKLSDLRHLSLSLRAPDPSAQGYDPFRCHMVIEAIAAGPLADVEAVFRLIPDQVQLVALPASSEHETPAGIEASSQRPGGRQRTMMRVDSTRIDDLLEIASELVIAKNALLPLANEARDHGNRSLARRISSNHHDIERLVTSLYGAVSQARMIPLEQTFRRFPRLVRDTATRLGKALDLVIEGETVEADREIVDNLFEPLLHLVRNSLDHGIEPEVERLHLSKPPRGRISLKARQRGDQIEIEVADDGRGINPERIRRTAIDKGLMSEGRVSALSEKDVLQLILAPGFSTASTVSDLSGRGVGLDAVQSSVHRLGGTLEAHSVLGSGSAFLLKLPISFSMTQLMVVEVGDERYGIPIADVLEAHRVPASAVQSVRAGRAFVLRDRVIPLLYLAELMRMPSAPFSGDLKVLILRVADETIGVAVDTIAERVETMTRPLATLLQGVAGIAGTTVLGDGKVLLVLKLEELVQ